MQLSWSKEIMRSLKNRKYQSSTTGKVLFQSFYILGSPLCLKLCSGVSEVAQSCLTLCDPIDCSLPGSSVHGIFQAIILEWIAISFSRGSSQPRDRTQVSCIVDRHFTVLSFNTDPQKWSKNGETQTNLLWGRDGDIETNRFWIQI